jgi:molybdopterin converting factor small subunit
VTAAVTPTPSPGTDPGPFPVVLPPPDVPRKPIYWTPTPDTNYWFNVRVDPNPVPFSGMPIPLQACATLPHTWYYATVLNSRTGNAFRVVERENYFDGFLVSRTTTNIELPGQQNTLVNSRWCSAFGIGHFTQHRFKVEGPEGVVILNSPIIELQANPSYVPPPPVSTTAQAGRRASQGATPHLSEQQALGWLLCDLLLRSGKACRLASRTMYVEFLGIPRERAGISELVIEADTLGQALHLLGQRFPALGELISAGELHPSIAANLNGDQFVSDPQTALADHDHLLILSSDVGG